MLKATLLASALGLIPQSGAATFTNNFNAGLPAGTAVHGSTVVESTGGVDNSGVLKITKAVNSQSGAFIIEDIDGGATIYGFDAAFKVRIGGGSATPADGFSFVFAPDIPDGAFSEEGIGGGITIAFDIYDNGGGEAPAIDVKVGGQVVSSTRLTIPQISTGNTFEPARVTLSPAGLLTLSYKGQALLTNFPLPGYQGISGRFAFGGRTGGLNANQWIDDLQITTFLTPQTGFTVQPRSLTVRAGATANISAGIANPDGVTFQWFKNNVPIVGATSATLSLPGVTTADSGAKYKLVATGPNNIATSEEATLTVVDIPLPAVPKVSLNFDDATVPADAVVTGSAFIDTTGGVGGTGVLKLTVNENGQAGTFQLSDRDGGLPVFGFTAQFDARVGGGSDVPADGFSFSLGSDIPETLPGDLEEGVGSGLRVTFDVYDNGGGEAPSVDIKYAGQVVASKKLPISAIRTGDGFVPVVIRMETDGSLDVVYNGEVIHNNVLVPGFSSLTGAKLVLAARTGGLNENFWFDNLKLDTTLTPSNLRITTQPTTTQVLVGGGATFTAAVNDATGVTFQWLRNGVAINGETSATLTLPAVTLADAGASYQLRATKGNVSVTSEAAVLNVVNLTAPTAPTISLDFNAGVTPAGTTASGNAMVDASGGVGDSGVMKITLNENGQSGAFVIDPLLSGGELSGFTAAFDVMIGGGSAVPADGFSFNFGQGLQTTPLGGAEEGTGNGLIIAFDTYDNGGGEAPSIDVKWRGAVIASTKMSIADITTGDGFRKVLVRLSADGKVDLAYGNRVLYSGLQLPNYQFTSNGRFGFYARTGGLNANHWVDNVQIQAVKSALPLRIAAEPQSVSAIAGQQAQFSVALSDPVGATYQWFRNGAPITGATSASFTTAATTAADNNAVFHVVATGPGGVVTSANATLKVVPAITVQNPILSANFDDGSTPATAVVAGTAMVDAGVVKLTEAVNGVTGSLNIGDLNGGQTVSAFTAKFSLRIGGGTSTPADGFSFVWANDLDVNAAYGEDGSGTGLIVSFDTYDNVGGEAPAIDIRWGGSEVVSRKLPISAIQTGDAFADVIIRLESDGTLDVHYKNQVIHDNVQLPGFEPQAGANFGFGARTGGLNDNHWIDNVQIATTVGAAAPRISAIRTGANGITIEWNGAATLQASDNAATGYTDVGTTSPFNTQATGRMRFFRLRR